MSVVNKETVSVLFSRFSERIRHSFDFMGDMAYVLACNIIPSKFNELSAYRFGGGLNLMKEGDTDGIWHLMESGMKQVLALSCCETCPPANN